MEMGGGESGGVGGGCHGLEGMAMGRDAQGGLESPWGGAGGGASEAGVVEGEGGGGSGGRGSGGGGGRKGRPRLRLLPLTPGTGARVGQKAERTSELLSFNEVVSLCEALFLDDATEPPGV
jgi:hypothetical protein